MRRRRGVCLTYLVDIWSLFRLHDQHGVDQVSEMFRIGCICRVLVSPRPDSHRNRGTIRLKWRVAVGNRKQRASERLQLCQNLLPEPVKREQEPTQMSTFSSKVLPVLTSKSSGARYGMVECSLAISWRIVSGNLSALAGML